MPKKQRKTATHKTQKETLISTEKSFFARLKKLPWKKILIISIAALIIGIIIVQLLYPYNKTMINAKVGAIDVSAMTHQDAKKRLQKTYEERELAIFFGEAKDSFASPKLAQLGVATSADSAANQLRYPLWLRFIPTSLWWGAYAVKEPIIEVALSHDDITSYTNNTLGDSCHIDPVNAGITVKNKKLEVVPSKKGGHCKKENVISEIQAVELSGVTDPSVRIAMETIKPKVSDEKAEKLIAAIEENLQEDVVVTYAGKNYSLQADTVRSWLTFKVKDDALVAGIDIDKANKPLHELLDGVVTKQPGVMTITTRDFQVVSQTGGGEGQQLNVKGTADTIMQYLEGEKDNATAVTQSIPPTKKYVRTYSSTDRGLSALMKNYAHDNPGTYGVSLIELSGKRRRAEFNGSKQFFPASTYKVFIAYSVLKRVENKSYSWGMKVTGSRNLKQCFNDMLVLSDNECPEALTLKIGVSELNRDLANLGLPNSKFVGPMKHTTTADDLSTFMAGLESGQNGLSSGSRNLFISTLKRDVFRQGIPAGATGDVANKVGFINALLHDTAIIYSPSGTYVLTILTENSSWGHIAELTKKIEALRTK